MADSRRRILLTGSNGQVGWELCRTLAPLGIVIPHDRASLDLADPAALRAAVQREKPDVIVNAAAYTDVNRAEDEPGLAHRINADAAEILATEAARAGALLVHYSTDYVFDGTIAGSYSEESPVSPLNAYGRSKAAGENAVLSTAARAYVFRLAWVYSLRGRNFLRTILRLTSEKDEIRVVSDQFGTPTWARLVAETTAVVVAAALADPAGERALPPGLYHLAAPDFTTWCDFAAAIVAGDLRPRQSAQPRVTPILASEYPTPARRPQRSVLDSSRLLALSGLSLPPWRDQLKMCLSELTA